MERLSWHMNEIIYKSQNGVLFIYQYINNTGAFRYSTFEKARQQGCIYLYETISENVMRTNVSYNRQNSGITLRVQQIKRTKRL